MSGVLLPILFVIISGGLYFSYIAPTYSDVQGLQKESADYDTLLNSAKKIRDKRAALTEQYKHLNVEDLTRLQKMVPDHIDNIRLLIDIDDIASTHGMHIKNIKFLTSGQGAGTASAATTPTPEPSAETQTGAGYQALSMSFSVTAPYDSLVSFLKDLEKSLRVLDVTSIAATAGDVDEKTGQLKLGSYQITLSTYWLPN